DGDAGSHQAGAALADGPAGALGVALAIPAENPAVPRPICRLGDAREGAGRGACDAAARRSDRAADARTGKDGRRRRAHPPARAFGFRLDGQRLTAIATDRGDQPADAAIVCAGAYSKPLAATLGDPVPLETERGYHLMIHDPEIMPRIPTADADGKFVATPMDT